MRSSLSIEISFEIPRCCRACLCMGSSEEPNGFVELLQPLSSSSKEGSHKQTLLKCFNECTQLEVAPELVRGSQPAAGEYAECRFLCNSCHEELQRAYEFITKARLSDRILSEHVKLKTEAEDQLVDEELFDEEEELAVDMQGVEALHENLTDNQLEMLEKPATSLDYGVDQQTQLERELAAMFGQEVTPDNIGQVSADFVETDTEELVSGECNKENVGTLISVECLGQEAENLAEVISCAEKDEGADILVKFVHSESEDEALEEEGEEGKHFFEFKCEFCTATYDYQSDLLHHYEKDHDNKNLHFPCEFCKVRFVTKNALRLHKRQIHQKCEYLDCPQCGRTVLKTFYGIHLKRHSKQLKLLCSKCRKKHSRGHSNTFTSKYTLNKHMELHSDRRDRNVECLDCGRKFYTLENLQLHRATHQDERVSYECTVCAKTFVRKSNLKLHMQLHRGETIDCTHCGKKFVRRKDLEIHIRFHTGDFPYVCAVCGKKFAIKGHLNYHEKRHSGLRYKCIHCEKTFINLAGLRQHTFEHTGMPLECSICMRGFPTKFKMRRHIRSVHNQLFEGVGYSDELAEQYMKQQDVPKADAKRELVKNEALDCIEMVEMIDNESDISENMLLA